jgi:signal transduction histidine kinase
MPSSIRLTEKKINLKAFKHKGKIKISVKDEGIGMDKHVLDQVFNIEKNFSTKGTRKEEGTGLGLILCKEFAETHGGSIEVDSEGGKGSLFTVSLPAKLKAE